MSANDLLRATWTKTVTVPTARTPYDSLNLDTTGSWTAIDATGIGDAFELSPALTFLRSGVYAIQLRVAPPDQFSNGRPVRLPAGVTVTVSTSASWSNMADNVTLREGDWSREPRSLFWMSYVSTGDRLTMSAQGRPFLLTAPRTINLQLCVTQTVGAAGAATSPESAPTATARNKTVRFLS